MKSNKLPTWKQIGQYWKDVARLSGCKVIEVTPEDAIKETKERQNGM